MSSNSAVIQVDNIGKCFSIYDRPEDRLKEFLMPKIRAVSGQIQRNYHREFWALRDVSFEVGKGQTVGIIGRNGSGKSTLLQIITGTMTPTYGSVATRGRTAALLELGSGFNPEFTGRENVYLNGSLLGLTHAQIDDKFDYIAGFADIGDHLDQPVKTYSSGMMLRLAFAVQVAVETEILIIDEALAVGDARFQLKCFRRLEEIKASGTTILFVSHATETVRSFCDFGLVLENGKAIYWGEAKTATVKYLELLFPEQTQNVSEQTDELAGGNTLLAHADSGVAPDVSQETQWLKIDPSNMEGHTFGVGGADLKWIKMTGVGHPNLLEGGREIKIQCQFSWQIEFLRELIQLEKYDPNITLGVSLADKKGNYMFGCNGFDHGLNIDCLRNGISTVEFQFVMPYLAMEEYFLTVAVALGSHKHHVQLRWYDLVYEFKNIKTDKHVYGVFAIDYKMTELTLTRDMA
jgi:lipopolysaccharide transport system ATP-binding protein